MNQVVPNSSKEEAPRSGGAQQHVQGITSTQMAVPNQNTGAGSSNAQNQVPAPGKKQTQHKVVRSEVPKQLYQPQQVYVNSQNNTSTSQRSKNRVVLGGILSPSPNQARRGFSSNLTSAINTNNGSAGQPQGSGVRSRGGNGSVPIPNRPSRNSGQAPIITMGGQEMHHLKNNNGPTATGQPHQLTLKSPKYISGSGNHPQTQTHGQTQSFGVGYNYSNSANHTPLNVNSNKDDGAAMNLASPVAVTYENANGLNLPQHNTSKIIRESRQRAAAAKNSNGAVQIDQKNPMLQAYIQSSYQVNGKASGAKGGHVGANGHRDATRTDTMNELNNNRIRANSDLKKVARLNLTGKISAGQEIFPGRGGAAAGPGAGIVNNPGVNHRDKLNQTTPLNVLSPSQTQPITSRNTPNMRGNPTGIVNNQNQSGAPISGQKRSQSVDRNAPQSQFLHQNHLISNQTSVGTQPFKAPGNIKIAPVNNLMLQDHQNHIPQLNQPNTVTGGAQGNGPKTHFIHDAIERKIERFSRQRDRAGTTGSQGSNAIKNSSSAAQAVYGQHLPGGSSNPGQQQFSNHHQGGGNNGGAGTGLKPVIGMQHSTGAMHERKRKAGDTPGAMHRGEIMSAGQPQVGQRKLTEQNQLGSLGNHRKSHHPSTMMNGGNQTQQKVDQQNNNFSQQQQETNENGIRNIYQILENYAPQGSKKSHHRLGSRGLPSTNNAQQAANHNQSGVPTGPLLAAAKIVQLPRNKANIIASQHLQNPNSHHADIEVTTTTTKVYRGAKIKLDKLQKEKGNKVVKAQARGTDNSNQASAPSSQSTQAQQRPSQNQGDHQQNPQIMQGSQGQQSVQPHGNSNNQKKKQREKIEILTNTVISMTTSNLRGEGRGQEEGKESDSDTEHLALEGPDDRAHITQQKRLSQKQISVTGSKLSPPNSPQSLGSGNGSPSHTGNLTSKKRSSRKMQGHVERHSHEGSKCSGTVSMRDESIMHMDVNSVTSDRYMRDGAEAQSYDSNDQASIKKQMIRYLSRVADRNKPLFVFNQKINLGGDTSDDSDTGTPSFSLVALVEQ